MYYRYKSGRDTHSLLLNKVDKIMVKYHLDVSCYSRWDGEEGVKRIITDDTRLLICVRQTGPILFDFTDSLWLFITKQINVTSILMHFNQKLQSGNKKGKVGTQTLQNYSWDRKRKTKRGRETRSVNTRNTCSDRWQSICKIFYYSVFLLLLSTCLYLHLNQVLYQHPDRKRWQTHGSVCEPRNNTLWRERER